MLQILEDALMAGFRLRVEMEFVVDRHGDPLVDVSVHDGERLLGQSIGCPSVEYAMGQVEKIVRGDA